MFYKRDSIYLYIVDFGSEFNGFGFLASDNLPFIHKSYLINSYSSNCV